MTGMPDRDYSLVGDEHVRRYVETDGEVGHLWNDVSCLVMWTTGRTSGERRASPLIYATSGDDVVVVASPRSASSTPARCRPTAEHRNDDWPVADATRTPAATP